MRNVKANYLLTKIGKAKKKSTNQKRFSGIDTGVGNEQNEKRYDNAKFCTLEWKL